MRFAKLALERYIRAHIEPERQIGTNGHLVKPVQVVALDAAGYRAGNQSIKVAVREDNKIGTQRGDDAVLELVVEIGGVHQRERHPCNRIFGQQRVDIFRHQAGTAQPHGLHGEAFGLQPFRQQGNLSRAARSVHAFYDDKGPAEFLVVQARKGQTIIARGGARGKRPFFRVAVLSIRFRGFHRALRADFLGANRAKSMRAFTIWRICFCSEFTGSVPSITTKRSDSIISSYCARMRP